MYCSNGSGMATLLQQKNCMKTLTNGGVTGGGTNVPNNVTSAGTNSLQQTRMLLPHEVVSIPSTSTLSNISNSTFVATGNNTSCYNQQQLFEQIPQQTVTTQQSSSNFGHNQVNNIHQFSRYFPQYNNIHEHNIIYMTTSASNSGNNTITNSQILHSSNYSTTPAVATVTTPLTQDCTYQEQLIDKRELNTEEQPIPDTSDSVKTNQNQSGHAENPEVGSATGCQEQIDSEEPSANSTNEAPPGEEDQEIDIVINNVVCSFSVRCHLNLREIALNGFNVEFRRENGMVTMKLRRPYTTASIWSSGRITCTGATSEEQAKIAARRYARCLQKLGFNVRFHNFRVVNVLGTCSMPWAIKIVNFSEKYRGAASYEPELHPGVTYRLDYPKATLKIFSTGSITVTAGSVAHVQQAIEHIYPLVYEFRKKRTAEDLELLRSKHYLNRDLMNEDDEIHSPSAKRRRPLGLAENDPHEDIMNVSDFEADDPDV